MEATVYHLISEVTCHLLCLLHLLQTSYQIQVILKERGFHKGVPTRRRRLVRTISAAGNNIVIHPIDKIKEKRSVAISLIKKTRLTKFNAHS